jgi:hypothetical protein
MDLTVAPGGGGAGVTQAAPKRAMVCWRRQDDDLVVTVHLDAACELDGWWHWNWRLAGGGGGVKPGQRCVLSMGDTTTTMTTIGGTLTAATYDGPVKVTVGGVTDDHRYVTIHFAGTQTGQNKDPWCDEMTANPLK